MARVITHEESAQYMSENYRHVFLENLLSSVYDSFDRERDKQLQVIRDAHTKTSMGAYHFFMYKGNFYPDNAPDVESFVYANKINVKNLHSSLEPAMKEYLADVAKLNEEKNYTKTYLATVLSSSDSVDDYYLMLPECMHQPLRSLLMRTQYRDFVTAYQIHDEQSAAHIMNQHIKAIDLIKIRLIDNLVSF